MGGGPNVPVVRRLSLDSPAQMANVSAGWKLAGTLRGVDIRPDAGAVVAGVSANGQEDLWVLELDGSGLRQLTSDAFFDRDPRWLGSGDRIVLPVQPRRPDRSLADRRQDEITHVADHG